MKIIDLITQTLHEDKPTRDITSDLLLPEAMSATAHVIAKSPGVFFGSPIIDGLTHVMPDVSFDLLVADGDPIDSNDVCVVLNGQLKLILEIERTLLNFLQRLSGIATTTAAYVTALNDSSIDILDTRKTTPLLRSLEKQAVCSGGGVNHRFGLHDMVLVKENHLALFLKHQTMDSFNEKLRIHKRRYPEIQIEVEVSSIELLQTLDTSLVDIIMFDNMTLPALATCLSYLNTQPTSPLKEVSGNISLESIHRYRGIDIDRISVGSLTHSVNALDLSLLVV